MLGGQSVRILARESKNTFIFMKGKLIHMKNPPRDQLVIGRDRYDIPEGMKPALVKTKPRGAKYAKFFLEENGQLVKFGDSINDPMPALMRPKDLGEEGERKSLAWLSQVTTDKSGLMNIILGAIIGIGLGYAIFTNYHPGLVTGAPPGYEYAVQRINATITSVTQSH